MVIDDAAVGERVFVQEAGEFVGVRVLCKDGATQRVTAEVVFTADLPGTELGERWVLHYDEDAWTALTVDMLIAERDGKPFSADVRALG